MADIPTGDAAPAFAEPAVGSHGLELSGEQSQGEAVEFLLPLDFIGDWGSGATDKIHRVRRQGGKI
jgi:hypothetical protein